MLDTAERCPGTPGTVSPQPLMEPILLGHWHCPIRPSHGTERLRVGLPVCDHHTTFGQMSARRRRPAVVLLIVTVVISTGTLFGPGIRHSHVGGDAAHSHTRATSLDHHSHDHHHAHDHHRSPHRGHAHHSHGLGHRHEKLHPRASTSGRSSDLQSPRTHVHLLLLGFELTLPFRPARRDRAVCPLRWLGQSNQ